MSDESATDAADRARQAHHREHEERLRHLQWKREAEDRRRRRLAATLSLAVTILSLTAVLVVGLLDPGGVALLGRDLSGRAVDESAFRAAMEDLEELKANVQAVEASLESLTGPVEPESVLAAEVDAVTRELGTVASRLQGLEAVILDDPTKALETTMLRSDVGQLEVELTQLREDMRGFLSVNQWIVGLMFAFISVVGFGTWLNRPREPTNTDSAAR